MKITRRQLRKLIMESLGGAQSGILKEFYHATTFPVKSFLNGIQIDKAKGFGQGAGFYVFTKKSDALAHARSITNPDSQISKEIEYSGDDDAAKIVVIDPPLTPENFDIDYEFMSHKLVEFAMKNKEQFIGLTVLYKDYPWKILDVKNIRGRNIMKFKGGATGRSRKTLSGAEGVMSTDDAVLFSAVANSMVNKNPMLFRRFEESVLENVAVLKYNGEKAITPLRIEDLEGNILWQRSFAQSFL